MDKRTYLREKYKKKWDIEVVFRVITLREREKKLEQLRSLVQIALIGSLIGIAGIIKEIGDPAFVARWFPPGIVEWLPTLAVFHLSYVLYIIWVTANHFFLKREAEIEEE